MSPEILRQMRVNACRQWLLPGSPEERGDALAASTSFFTAYYLTPDPENRFDPFFFDDPPLVTPPFHKDVLRSWGRYAMSIWIAPRGSAKSMLFGECSTLQLLTKPAFSTAYITSTHENAEVMGQRIRGQFTGNSRIFDDFHNEQEFDGRIVPARGQAPFGIRYFQLRNGSYIRLVSMQSRARGMRPKVFAIDDAEHDERTTQKTSDSSLIRANFEHFLFKIAIPTVLKAGSSIRWINTFVSKRHFAWHAMQTRTLPDGNVVAEEPRFDFWFRSIIKACAPDPNDPSKLISAWPHMWPIDEAQKKALNLDPSTKTIAHIRQILGEAAFKAEMMAEPDSGAGATFGDITRERHGWWIKPGSSDANLADKPWDSDAVICWNSTAQGKSLREMKLRDFLVWCKYSFVLADYAFTQSATSDFKTSCLVAHTPDNELFVLDAFAERCSLGRHVKAIFKMAERWRCPNIFPETVKESFSLYTALKNTVATRSTTMAAAEFLPRVKPLPPTRNVAKEDKIAGLQLWFTHDLIKVPFDFRYQRPWSALFDQIEGFNADARNGGLEHDDLIDTVSMALQAIRGKPIAPSRGEPSDVREDLIKRLLAGETHDELGLSIVERLGGWNALPPEVVNQVYNQSLTAEKTAGTLA